MSSQEEFMANIDMLTEYVVPYSAKKFKIPEKDGLSIWYILFYVGKSISLLKNAKKRHAITKKRTKLTRSEEKIGKIKHQFKSSLKRPEKGLKWSSNSLSLSQALLIVRRIKKKGWNKNLLLITID